MRLAYVFAAVAALALSLPAIASAETTVIKKKIVRDEVHTRGHIHRDHGWHRGEYRHHDRGWHRGHRGDRTVIIKHRD